MMRKVLCEKMGLPVTADSVVTGAEGEKEAKGAAADCEDKTVGGAHDASGEAAVADAAPEPAPAWSCPACAAGFVSVEELEAHGRRSVPCAAASWQAAVHAIACLPGAGTTLWCPACPSGFMGRWSGQASKAGALLRHTRSASSRGSPHIAPHRRFGSAVLALLWERPPPGGANADLDGEALEDWASTSRLAELAGPLLAKANPVARQAVYKLQDEVLGPDAAAASTPATEVMAAATSAAAEADSDDEGVGAAPVPDPTLRILGLDLTVCGSGLYTEDIPIDGGPSAVAYEEPLPGAESAGCQLPAGGISALTCMDLTVDSSEDEAPPPRPAKGLGATACPAVQSAPEPAPELLPSAVFV